MARPLAMVPALGAPHASLSRSAPHRSGLLSLEGAALVTGLHFVLQLGCSLDERHPMTAENAIEGSGGTPSASRADDTAPPVASGGSAGAALGNGTAPSSLEAPSLPSLTNAADGGVTSSQPMQPPPAAAGPEAPPSEPPATATCDTSRPFQTPVLVGGLTSPAEEYGLWLTPDELTAYFASSRRDLGGAGDYDLYRATRSTIAQPFAQPSLVPIVNSAFNERKAVLSADGQRLFFSSDRPGLGAGEDIYVSVRPNTSSEFGVPGLLSGINSADGDLVHSITQDGRYLYFDRPVAGAGRDIFLFDLAMAEPTRAVTELESPYDDGHALASADGLTVYWATTRVSLDDSAGSAPSDIWSARRASPMDPLGSLTAVAELNTPSAETVHYLSADGCRIYIGSERSGRAQLYLAARPPP